MTPHSLAELFDGAGAVEREIARRAAGPAEPVADAELTVERYHPRRLDLTVTAVVPETATTTTFRMRRTGGGELPPFLAGQYVNLFVEVGGIATSRPLAISSSPARREVYDLTVRRVPGGRVSNHLIDHLAAGDRLSSTGPMGTFHHNPLFHGDDVVFLAGGSGVAPAMSMIRDVVDHGLPRRLHLVYGSRREDDVIFRHELDRLARAHPAIRVDHVILDPEPGWTGRAGLITAETIAALAGPLGGRMVYVCGPQAMYPYALGQLGRLGHPRRRVRFEANGAPARPETRPGWPRDLDPAGEVTVTVRGGPSFSTPRNRPLLDALEDHGVRPEVACRSGECSLCRVRVVAGDVFSAQEARLRTSDRRFGWVHGCVAFPLSDVEIVA
jgi:ferredoxin-NADP reductase